MQGQDDGLFIQEKSDALDYSNGLVSNSGAMGVHGVEIPLNGSLGGHVGHKHFYDVQNPRITIKEQSNLTDMTEKIKAVERVRPNYTIGIQQK